MKFLLVLCIIILSHNFNLRIAKAQDDDANEETTTVESDGGEGEDEEESDMNPDYSSLNLNYTKYPNGGVLVQYTQKGLDYIVGMAERAVLKLVTTFPIPDVNQDDFSMKNVKVEQFDKPKLLTKFINQTGMEVKLVMSKMEVSAEYSYTGGWVSSEGKAKCNIKNLVVNMLIRIEEGRHGLPAIKIPVCGGKIQRFRIVFSSSGWGGSVLNSLRGMVESMVTTTMGDLVCFAARNTTGMIETIFLDWDAPAVGPTIDPAVICGEDIKQQQKSQQSGGVFNSIVAELEGLSVDMNTNGSAYFDDDEVVVGLKGDFAFRGKKTHLYPELLVLPHTERMICFAVKEIVVNSFGVIAQEQKYFEYNEVLEVSELPAELRIPLKVICPKCRLQMFATAKDPVRVEFEPTGVKAYVSGFMQISGTGLFGIKIKVVEAIFELESLANLVIDKQHTIRGSVDMGKITVKILDYGLGGVFDRPLNALLRKLIPKFIWPISKRKIDKMINEKGFKLPAACGLSFNNTQITYVKGAVIVSTDFLYDLEGFVDRFMAWQLQQMAINSTKTSVQQTLPAASTEDQNTDVEEQRPPPTTTSKYNIQTLSYND